MWCFTGECVNSQGFSLTAILAQEYGLLFGLAYVASYMLVAMGIFNVILAVYAFWKMLVTASGDHHESGQGE